MPLKLFDRKRRCVDTHLKTGEQVTALSGFGSHVVAGTSQSRILIFNASSHWDIEYALGGLDSDEDSSEPVAQICCASALDLILLVIGDELVGLEMKDEFSVSNVYSGVYHCALNTHPTSSDPFAIQLAICHKRKQHIVIGQIGAASSTEFAKQRKVPTQGRVVACAFSGHCLCYATSDGAYFVHNLQLAKGNEALKLFDSSTPSTLSSGTICAFGKEEFALSGVSGLIMFVNGHGISSKAPIAVNNEYPVVGISLKEPFLYVLGSDGTLAIYSTIDDQHQQSLVFPCDEPSRPDHNYQLANIDGMILLLPPSGDCLFELVSVPIIAQLEEQLLTGNFDETHAMMDKNAAHFATSASEEEILKMRELRKRLAFIFIRRGDFAKGVELLAVAETDPRELILLISKQYPRLQLEHLLASSPSTPTDEDFPSIPLEIVKQYLEHLLHDQSAERHLKLIECTLARIYAWLDDLNSLEKLPNKAWNDTKFREWLISERELFSSAASFAADMGCFEEAFAAWKKLADNGALDKDGLDECCATLFRVQVYTQLVDALQWFIPLNAKKCMDAVEALEQRNPEGRFPPDDVVRLFSDSQPVLLLHYLDRRIFELDSPQTHNKLLELYIHFVKSEETKHDAARCRSQLRHFLLFSNHYSRELAIHQFGNTDLFGIEVILTEANKGNAVNCLQLLIKDVGNRRSSVDDEDALSAAQLLCTRYPSAEMLTTMLTMHLKLSRSDPALRAHIPAILSLLDPETSAAEVFRNVPEDMQSSDFVHSFLRRHVAHQLNASEWQRVRWKFAEREWHRATGALANLAAGTKFCVDEHTNCAICERKLKADDEFVRHPHNGQLTHLRCHEKRKGTPCDQ